MASGATLGISNNVNYSTAEALEITGLGIGAAGALRNIQGSNTWSGAVTLGAESTIDASAGQMVLAGTVAFGANALTITNVSGATITVAGGMSGSGALLVNGAGLVQINAATTYSGAATVAGGTLQLNAANAMASVTSLTLNPGGTLPLTADNSINDSAAINLAFMRCYPENYHETHPLKNCRGRKIMKY